MWAFVSGERGTEREKRERGRERERAKRKINKTCPLTQQA